MKDIENQESDSSNEQPEYTQTDQEIHRARFSNFGPNIETIDEEV